MKHSVKLILKCLAAVLFMLNASMIPSEGTEKPIDRIVLTPNIQHEGYGATVTFRAEGRCETGYVEYRDGENSFKQKAVISYNEKQDYTVFKAEITGLKSGSKIEYRSVSGKNQSRWSTFNVHKDGEPLSFIFMGDSQEDPDALSGYGQWGSMLNEAADIHSLDLILLGGDLINEGSDEGEWDRYFEGTKDVFGKIMTAPAVGNHDNTKLFRSIFSVEGFYSFDLGEVHFSVLDSNKMGGADENDLAWFENDLKNSSKPWKVVLFHHPVYKTNEMNRDDWRSEIYSEKWVPIMEKYGADIVLNGHQHAYMRTYPMKDGKSNSGGITYIMGVSGGKSYAGKSYEYTEALYGDGPVYSCFSVSENSLKMISYDERGNEIDSFVLSKENREDKDNLFQTVINILNNMLKQLMVLW